MYQESFLTVEEGWPIIQEGIDKKIRIIDGFENQKFSAKELIDIYTAGYKICEFYITGIECQKLYDRHCKVHEYYIFSKVLPFLKGKKEDRLVHEVVKRWKNYKQLTRWMERFIGILDRDFLPFKELPSLKEASYSTFFKLVLDVEVRKHLVCMIERQSKGEAIDQDLLKAAIDMYVEIGNEYFEKHFKYDILKQAYKFYSSYSNPLQ